MKPVDFHPDAAREAQEAARRLGIDATEVLDHHDGQLLPDVNSRWEIVRQIRNWRADLVLTHRPYDYHPDHRYTAQLVQDSAYLVVVPNVCPDAAPLRRNPVFLYLEDHFRRPIPFAADVAVDISDVWECKMDALDAHASQFYEWLPWVDGVADQVPRDPSARREWLSANWSHPPCGPARAALASRYGSTANSETGAREGVIFGDAGDRGCAQLRDLDSWRVPERFGDRVEHRSRLHHLNLRRRVVRGDQHTALRVGKGPLGDLRL